jgi:hypothetical protein
MPVQTNWRWCIKCQVLFYGSRVMNSHCPAGGTHSPVSQSGSGEYTLSYNVPIDSSQQNDWRWCNKCQGLFFGPNAASSHCPAGGTHSSVSQSGSGNYSLLHHYVSVDQSQQNEWRWCYKCQGLFFGGNAETSHCPAGGTHSRVSQSGNGDYVLKHKKFSTINWPWAIILCRFNNVSTIPQQSDYYVDLFTRNGTGGMCDYWRAVSCNTLDLTGSEIFGWFTMTHSSTELSQLNLTSLAIVQRLFNGELMQLQQTVLI